MDLTTLITAALEQEQQRNAERQAKIRAKLAAKQEQLSRAFIDRLENRFDNRLLCALDGNVHVNLLTELASLTFAVGEHRFVLAYQKKGEGPSYPWVWTLMCNGKNTVLFPDVVGVETDLLLYIALMTGQSGPLTDELNTKFFGDN